VTANLRSRIGFGCLALAALLLTAPAAGARTLKIATVVPEGSAWMQDMRQAAAEIREKTQGRVQFKFYPGGVMGNDKTVLRKMRAGQLQGGAFTSGALSQIFPDLELYGAPLLLRSYAEVDYVRSRMDPYMVAGLERAGLVALAITDAGFAYLMSQRPMSRVDDLGGAKVWIQEADVMSAKAFEIAGITPVQLSLADVYTALQTGLVDTVTAPPMGAIALQWHTKVKYLTDFPLTYLNGVFAIDARVFGRLQPGDQAIVREVVREAARGQDASARVGAERAKEALRQQGIEFVDAANPQEVERWRDIGRRTLRAMRAGSKYSEETIDALQRHLEDYRRSQDGSAD
jgi:TRAP-type C4-dicarboxylate transport system substrate-binding protein